MAGIGFELLKLWQKGSYGSLLRAFTLTGLMSYGPGLFIIISLSIVCFLNLFPTPDSLTGYQFLSLITYLLASSMILSALLQYTLFRFMADKVFDHEFNLITPNLIGALFVQQILSLLIAVPSVLYFFSSYGMGMKILLISNFNILCMIWLAIVLLSGLKAYKFIIWGFVLGYFSMILVHFLWVRNDLFALLFEYLLAQAILLVFLLYAILDYYPTKSAIRFDFLKRENFYFTLVFSNFFYALGFWIDKFLFWYNSSTGYIIIPPLRLSPIYDLPIFIAYLTVIPAASVFLLQIEANFSIIYPHFMNTIFQRKTLGEINAVRNELVVSGQNALYKLFKTQTAVIVIMFLLAQFLLKVLGISPIYLNLLLILLVSVGLNIVLWGILSILYYMTQYVHALYVTFIFLLGNVTFTLITLKLGPYYYGYGLGMSFIFAIATGLYFLNKDFDSLEYSTFMLTD